MAEQSIAITLALIGLAIVLFLPAPISKEYKLIATSIMILLIVGIILYIYIKKIKEMENKQMKLIEKLKIYELLVDMKGDIKELQRKVFKK